ncbi:MAG: hypothetical protein FJ145_04600 [Deltaproteobacteria bacterium]|nr:hypothetical protein [Deltaproteobacteria bacterium]
MLRTRLRLFSRRLTAVIAVVTLMAFFVASAPALAMDAVRGGALPQPLPLFPADNWWNLDISSWPVDQNSTNYISFINNGGTRRLHPDFGGNDGTQYGIYGIPYAVVTNLTDADRKPVQFQYWDESDGVDYNTGKGVPFYPIPPQAITEGKWIEGGEPGNIDRRNSQDRHLLIVDKDSNHLYELYNVYYDSAQGKWFGGSGAFFDMNTNDRRPDTWTSADAAGLAILPGLVRYDEVYDPNVAGIKHAFRVTVRATNGYVYPASHRAGSTAGALPMGARLRLKPSVDVAQRTSDPNVQKIFRAMQKYGSIVADNGSDMFVTGTYDTRWNNNILNPAFRSLTASDFEVIQLGYNPTTSTMASLSSVSAAPRTITGGQSTTGTVSLTTAAPNGGAVVSLSSANPAVTVPASVTVLASATTANFAVNTSAVSATTIGNITATYAGVTKSTILTVNPVALQSLSLNPTSVSGGATSIGTVTLTSNAPADGAVINLSSSRPTRASVPTTVTVLAGTRTATFTVSTTRGSKRISATISATYGGVTKGASLTVR